MKHPTLSTSLLLAALFLLAACGGGGGGGQSSAPGKAGTKTEAKATKGGNKWPDNEYTKLLPKPEITVSSASVGTFADGETFAANFASGTTREQFKAYIEQLKASGFTVKVEVDTDSTYGGTADKDGYHVSWTYIDEKGSIQVNKNK